MQRPHHYKTKTNYYKTKSYKTKTPPLQKVFDVHFVATRGGVEKNDRPFIWARILVALQWINNPGEMSDTPSMCMSYCTSCF
jgi:hypothetical protein